MLWKVQVTSFVCTLSVSCYSCVLSQRSNEGRNNGVGGGRGCMPTMLLGKPIRASLDLAANTDFPVAFLSFRSNFPAEVEVSANLTCPEYQNAHLLSASVVRKQAVFQDNGSATAHHNRAAFSLGIILVRRAGSIALHRAAVKLYR